MTTIATTAIKLGGREFHVSCAPEERDALQEAAALLNGKMSGIKTRNTGERLIVMAALELARDSASCQRRLDAMGKRLDDCGHAS